MFHHIAETALDYGLLVGSNCEFVLPVDDKNINDFKNRSMILISDLQWTKIESQNFTEPRNEIFIERFEKLMIALESIDEFFAGNFSELSFVKKNAANATAALFVDKYVHETKRSLITDFYAEAFNEIKQRLDDVLSSNPNNEDCKREVEHLKQKTETDYEICLKLSPDEFDLKNVQNCDFIAEFAYEIDQLDKCLSISEFMDCATSEKQTKLSQTLNSKTMNQKSDITVGLLCFSKSLRALLVHEVYGLKTCENMKT